MSRPRDTEYRLAVKRKHIQMCRELLIQVEGVDGKERLEKPIVMGIRHDKLLGFISTRTTKKFVQLGRLIVAPGSHRKLTWLRLIEAYERALQWFHVRSYIMGVRQEQQDLIQLMDGMGWRVYQKRGEILWYQREVGTSLFVEDYDEEQAAWERRRERRRQRIAAYRQAQEIIVPYHPDEEYDDSGEEDEEDEDGDDLIDDVVWLEGAE